MFSVCSISIRESVARLAQGDKVSRVEVFEEGELPKTWSGGEASRLRARTAL